MSQSASLVAAQLHPEGLRAQVQITSWNKAVTSVSGMSFRALLAPMTMPTPSGIVVAAIATVQPKGVFADW